MMMNILTFAFMNIHDGYVIFKLIIVRREDASGPIDCIE